MSIKLSQEGLVVEFDAFDIPQRASQGSELLYLDSANSEVLLHDMGEFFPAVYLEGEKRATFQMWDGDTELCSTSISIKQAFKEKKITKEEWDDFFKRLHAAYKDFKKLAKDPNTDRSNRLLIQCYELPSYKFSPEFFRWSNGYFMVIWGCLNKQQQESSIARATRPPMQVPSGDDAPEVPDKDSKPPMKQKRRGVSKRLDRDLAAGAAASAIGKMMSSGIKDAMMESFADEMGLGKEDGNKKGKNSGYPGVPEGVPQGVPQGSGQGESQGEDDGEENEGTKGKKRGSPVGLIISVMLFITFITVGGYFLFRDKGDDMPAPGDDMVDDLGEGGSDGGAGLGDFSDMDPELDGLLGGGGGLGDLDLGLGLAGEPAGPSWFVTVSQPSVMENGKLLVPLEVGGLGLDGVNAGETTWSIVDLGTNQPTGAQVDSSGNVALKQGRYRVTATGTDSAGQPFSAEKRIELILTPSFVDLDAPKSPLGDLGIGLGSDLDGLGGLGGLDELGLPPIGAGGMTLPSLRGSGLSIPPIE